MGREGGLREIGNWCCTSCWWVGMSFRGTGNSIAAAIVVGRTGSPSYGFEWSLIFVEEAVLKRKKAWVGNDEPRLEG
jgi:hypothetical protein